MNSQYQSTGFRASFERIFAGIVYASTLVYVIGGAIAVCLQSAPLAA
jgi:hypothetical protein